MDIRQFIYKYLWWTYRPLKKIYLGYKIRKYNLLEIERVRTECAGSQKRIFYLGITEQPNLGDMGQHYCIKKWITENYPDYKLIMVESSVITTSSTTNTFFDMFKQVFSNEDDRIIALNSNEIKESANTIGRDGIIVFIVSKYQ
jgi:hypothetical protein